MKKIFTLFLIIIFFSIGLFAAYYYQSRIVNIQKAEYYKIQSENKKLISEREDIKEKYSEIDKEKSVLYTSTLLLKDKVDGLSRSHEKDREMFSSDQANFLSRISSLSGEKEDVLKAISEKDLYFNRKLSELEKKLEGAESVNKELNNLLSEKDEELKKISGDSKGLKSKRTEVENMNLELSNKVRTLNEKIEGAEKSKNDYMTLATGLKKELLDTRGKLQDAEKEINRFETNYDSTALKHFRQNLEKEFAKERDAWAKERSNWDKEKKDLEVNSKKQEDTVKNIALKLTEIQNKLTEEKNKLTRDKEALTKKNNALENSLKEEKFNYYYTKGLNFYQKKMYKDAVVEFEKAKELNASDAKIYYNLGIIYDDFIIDKKKAVEYYKKYLKLNPKTEDRQKIEEWIEAAGK